MALEELPPAFVVRLLSRRLEHIFVLETKHARPGGTRALRPNSSASLNHFHPDRLCRSERNPRPNANRRGIGEAEAPSAR